MLNDKCLDPNTTARVDKEHCVRLFTEAPETKEDIPFMDLEAIDLSRFVYGSEGLAERQNLAKQLEGALTAHGFFKLVGHGVAKEELDRMKSIGQGIFELDESIKKKFLAGEHNIPEEKDKELGIIRGSGFKPKGYWEYLNGKHDVVEFFNVRHFNHDDYFFNKIKYPEFVKYHLNEISSYFKYLHFQVLRKLLNLIDIILEIPEGYLWENHFKVYENDLIRSGGGVGRFLMYHESDKDYKEKTHGTWMRGHSDATALTFIISQPIASLQIRDHNTGEWKYVSHTNDSLVVNIGDAFKFLSGSYFKSSLHRVVTPPDDQAKYKRNTVIYFCNPSLTTVLDPWAIDSPKLKRLGYVEAFEGERLTFGQWDEAKGSFFNKKHIRTSKEVNILGRSTLMSYIEEVPKEMVNT
ncbi:hypothetical protein DASC09_008040 [Saccharomycopsis crataegensis]|uniref:Fe2OG dioxygenase domain-containing protein n=1 Tax=Saccharomycopsis crataegensis TaxID=43959 RepID=A0AAV5QGI3_9ASCO|nr:hypothetical protein DASC09_008040 [Saccharomycopsis crataegensis]